MVWAKTKMKVMPKDCRECCFSQHHGEGWGWYCILRAKLNAGVVVAGWRRYPRPDDCPLREDKEVQK